MTKTVLGNDPFKALGLVSATTRKGKKAAAAGPEAEKPAGKTQPVKAAPKKSAPAKAAPKAKPAPARKAAKPRPAPMAAAGKPALHEKAAELLSAEPDRKSVV